MNEGIQTVSADELGDALILRELVDLLVEVVDAGGSLGFVAPLGRGDAEAYWRRTAHDIEGGSTHLLAYSDAGQAIVGSVQLQLSPWPDGPHRAEIAKLMVHPAKRRLGIATSLMDSVEALAIELGRTLLTLNTRVGDPSERLYERRGYESFGVVPRYVADGKRTYDKSHWYRDLQEGLGRSA